jgi:hypothetical protein
MSNKLYLVVLALILGYILGVFSARYLPGEVESVVLDCPCDLCVGDV